MAQSKKASAKMKKLEHKEQVQGKKLKEYEKKQRLLKWVAIILLILLLLALLVAGYATDWTRGLKKDASIGSLDSANQGSSGGLDSGNFSASGANGRNGTDGSNGGGSSTTTTTTTYNSTTSNPPGGGGDNSTLIDELIQLYNETGTGDNLDDVISRAESTGIDVDCDSDVLTRDCTFSADGQNFSVRSLMGTGLITGILDGV